MQRRGTDSVVRASSDYHEEADAGSELPSARDFAWFHCGCWLMLGGLLPSLLACCFYKEILAAESIKRLITFAATDLLFAAASYMLMLEGQRFGRDRNPGVQLVRYPGPWVELSGIRRFPRGFKQYLLAMPATVGLMMPAAALVGSLIWGDEKLLLATCLVPYLGTLLCQIWMEGHFTKRGSFMWPQVPIIHMYYRMTQLARAFALNAALSGPAYIFTILALLACVWVFNIGAVVVWMPWLYRWQCQPTADK